MDDRPVAATVALLGGLLCFVVLVFIGKLTGSALAAWTVVSLICFAVSMGICWDQPGNLWFTGLLLNVAVWLFMILVVDLAQIKDHLAGMTAPIIFAYLGALIGWGYPQRARKKVR